MEAWWDYNSHSVCVCLLGVAVVSKSWVMCIVEMGTARFKASGPQEFVKAFHWSECEKRQCVQKHGLQLACLGCLQLETACSWTPPPLCAGPNKSSKFPVVVQEVCSIRVPQPTWSQFFHRWVTGFLCACMSVLSSSPRPPTPAQVSRTLMCWTSGVCVCTCMHRYTCRRVHMCGDKGSLLNVLLYCSPSLSFPATTPVESLEEVGTDVDWCYPDVPGRGTGPSMARHLCLVVHVRCRVPESEASYTMSSRSDWATKCDSVFQTQ